MLKSVLALLLSKFVKKTDTEFIASQAMPEVQSRKIWLKQDVFGNIEDVYTAPSNGYLCINAGTAIENVTISGAVSSRVSVHERALNWPQVFIVAAKGETLTYRVGVLSDQTQTGGTRVYFIPSVGTPSS